MFSEEFSKGGNRNVKSVGAIVLLKSSKLSLRTDAIRLLKFLDLGLRLGVDLVGQRAKRLLRGIVEKTALLEQKRHARFITDLIRTGL